MASTARLDELKKKFDENPRRYFAPLANEHRKSGDLDQAISLCRAHLPQQPAHISGHIVLAQALFEAGSVDESREIFLAALGLDPENLIALRYLGDIAREASDVDTARSWYQRVLEVDPRNDEIVQLIRDLDMPRPVVTPEATIAPDVPIEAVTASPVRAAPTPAANNDARFAPLSMEDFDVGTDAPSESSDAERDGPAEPAATEASFDVHSAWGGDSSTVGQSAPDAEEHDPFDLHSSASAESLFDGGTDTAANDLFLSELSQVNGSDDGSDLSAADAQNTTFEEGFYLEPAPSAPADAAASPSSEHLASDAETPITASTAPTVHAAPEPTDAFVAESTVTHEEPSQAESYRAASMTDPNADALALFADTQTAEWEPPTSDVASIAHTSSDDALGLEVMEFVPPSREATPSSIADATSYADAEQGGTPDLGSAEQENVPAAFVTETMAELYLQQGFRNEALAVYRELLSRNPADASLRERVDQIESGSMSSLGMATLSEDVVESARKRQTGRPARSVRSFFASLASRRAPSPPSQSYVGADATDDPPTEAPAADYALVSDPVTAAESPTTSEPLNNAPAASASERISPLTSAAEALANYDPFADTAESMTPGPSQSIAPDTSLGDPHTEYRSESTPVESVAAPDPVSPRSSLEDLFPNAPVTARTEAVAQAFATAFGRDEPQGRPTRAASNELSLDHVFRGSAESAGASDGGFSFDQFFSDARPAGGGDVAAPVVSAPDTGRSAGPSGDAHDIEQFTAWLEGLKKK